ncbi:MAG: hypothetical protein KBD31_05670 [Proteobacteria bacterium]|nr:hypothetical protein [Pseudomonadota bacterium]
MSHPLIQKLNDIKEQLIKWPDDTFFDAHGKQLNSDDAFKVIESDLREVLNKIIVLPDEERSLLKDTIEEFKNTMAKRQEEAEKNLKELREKIALNKDTTKAMRAYGKAFKRQELATQEPLNEPHS